MQPVTHTTLLPLQKMEAALHTLDLLGVPYTITGIWAAAWPWDAECDRSERMMDSLGIRTAPWHDIHYTESDIPRLAEELPVPCAVKIVNGGSSIGVALPDKKIVRAKRDTNGNKVTELVKSKNGNEYLKVVKEEVTEKRQKDMPSRLNARRKIMNTVCKVKDADGRNIDIPAKLFGELAERYATAGKVGGYLSE